MCCRGFMMLIGGTNYVNMFMNDVVVASVDTELVWSRISTLNIARISPAAAVLPHKHTSNSNKVIVCGGMGRKERLRSCELLTALNAKWTMLTQLHTARYASAAVLDHGQMILLGGMRSRGGSLATAEVIDMLHNRSILLNTRLARACHYAIAIPLPSINVADDAAWGKHNNNNNRNTAHTTTLLAKTKFTFKMLIFGCLLITMHVCKYVLCKQL